MICVCSRGRELRSRIAAISLVKYLLRQASFTWALHHILHLTHYVSCLRWQRNHASLYDFTILYNSPPHLPKLVAFLQNQLHSVLVSHATRRPPVQAFRPTLEAFEPPSLSPPVQQNHHLLTGCSVAMDDEATQEPPAQSGQLSLQTSSATASADQPIIATSFPQFAFLPEEIRRLIWQYACIPTRMQFLQFPTYCALPRVGRLDDPADAPKFNYDGVRDDLAMLIANSENYQQQWSVPGCHKFRRFFWRRDLNGLSAVCPESRDVYFNLVKHTEQNRLTIKKGVHVNDSFDIFHFSTRNPLKFVTAFLLNMRPRLRRK